MQKGVGEVEEVAPTGVEALVRHPEDEERAHGDEDADGGRGNGGSAGSDDAGGGGHSR